MYFTISNIASLLIIVNDTTKNRLKLAYFMYVLGVWGIVGTGLQ